MFLIHFRLMLEIKKDKFSDIFVKLTRKGSMRGQVIGIL